MPCLVISAASGDIQITRGQNGAKSVSKVSRAAASLARTPATMRSGWRKTSSALPSRKFSGL